MGIPLTGYQALPVFVVREADSRCSHHWGCILLLVLSSSSSSCSAEVFTHVPSVNFCMFLWVSHVIKCFRGMPYPAFPKPRGFARDARRKYRRRAATGRTSGE